MNGPGNFLHLVAPLRLAANLVLVCAGQPALGPARGHVQFPANFKRHSAALGCEMPRCRDPPYLPTHQTPPHCHTPP